MLDDEIAKMMSDGERRNTALRRRKRRRSLRIIGFCYYYLILCQFTLAQEPICDYYGDTCRSDWQLDGHCDDSPDTDTESGCRHNDCFDCDPCQTWSYACGACLEQEGCYWCPGDAICLSQRLEAVYWTVGGPKGRISRCPNPEDWQTTCNVPPDNGEAPFYPDIFYPAMEWMFDLIHVQSVWAQGITGRDVRVRVNSDGIDPFHQEFIANFDEPNSCDDKYPVDPAVNVVGSAVASILGAQSNGACSVGIAPNVKISSCNVNQSADLPFVLDSQLPNKVDISLNPWQVEPCKYKEDRRLQQQFTPGASCPFDANHPESPCPYCTTTDTLQNTRECQEAIQFYCRWYFEPICLDYLELFVTCQYRPLDAGTQDLLRRNILEGRDGRGVVLVVPAGDGNRLGGDANMDGWVRSRFAIAVAAVDPEGMHAPYSTPGAPVRIAAPGGGEQYVTNHIVANPSGGCRDAGFGTWLAVPVVGGVVALMLEANPELGWRDVSAILVQTARQVDADGGNWTTNAAGYAHSYQYGFGIVQAAEAVEAAKNWTNFPSETQISLQSDAQYPIVDDIDQATVATLNVEFVNPSFHIESVSVSLDLTHGSRGDLKITLTSPGGTESILAPSKRPEYAVTSEAPSELWEFMTVRNYWEYPGGEWELRIVDEYPGEMVGCIDYSWEYIYTMGRGGAGEIITCSDFDAVSDCTDEEQVDPLLLTQEFEGRTMLQSCCNCGGGENRQNRTSFLNSWQLAIHGHIAGDVASASDALYNITESTCLFSVESCPEGKQFNRVCDNGECVGGDCFDCDACQAFTFDCTACVEAGCNYCPGDGICMSLALNESFWQLHPNKTSSCPTSTDWRKTCEKRAENSFDDPLYETMLWSYEMINVELPWNRKVSGKGVHVRINDDGVAEHLEFEGKYDKFSSCTEYLPRDPVKDTHGTAVASIVAGNENDECAVGIAPGATISSCVGPDKLHDAPEMLLSKLETVDISVNSWGPNVCHLINYGRERRLQQCLFSSEHPDSPCGACGDFSDLNDACEVAVGQYCSIHYEDDEVACAEYFDLWVSCAYHLLPMDAHESFVKAITEGRNGSGVIFVFSAGNNHDRGGDTNFNGFLNSRFTIAVGAVGKDKKHASYSTTGASVFVSAPGGDFDSVSGNIVAKPGGGCHDISVGTSFSAPVVAGAIALMLQVRSDLSWRDVQGILALESQDFEPEDPSWVTNAAGYRHSYKYGFGVVSVHDCLNRASVWKSFGKEKQLMNQTGQSYLEIEDANEKNITTTSRLSIQEATTFIVESVVVYLDIPHPSRGDLLICLTSPGGTEAILAPSKRPENTQLEGGDDDFKRWKLLSLRTWGEFPSGEWKLSIQDQSVGNYGDCVDIPWESTHAAEDDAGGNETLSCRDFAVIDCKDVDQVNPVWLTMLYQDRTALESCCSCGGGQSPTSVAPLLRSWKLVVYGHNLESEDDIIAPLGSGGGGGGGTDNGNSTNGTGNLTDIDFSNAGDGQTNGDGDGGSGSSGWDDGGNSGIYSGGGGTAYWSEGWNGKLGIDSSYASDTASGACKQLSPADTLVALAVFLLGLAAVFCQ